MTHRGVRLAASNIAWPRHLAAEALAVLERAGIGGLEAAPGLLFDGDWTDVDSAVARATRADLEVRRIEVPALQGILFGQEHLRLFGDRTSRDGLADHLVNMGRLAQGLGAGVLVFGAPRNRVRGDLGERAALDRAVDFFRHVGERLAALGVTLTIEPLPRAYGCDFIHTVQEAAELVERTGSSGIGLQLDVGSLSMADESPDSLIPDVVHILKHVHASEPHLQVLGEGEASEGGWHRAVGGALERAGYDGWVSAEMRASEDPISSLKRAVAFLESRYGSER